MQPPATDAPHDGVLYDSPRTPLVWKAVVSLATGFALAWFMSFLRWFARQGSLGALTPPMLALGVAVSAVMLATALRSRVVRRVEVSSDGATLILYRDPGTVERITFADLTDARSERAQGGWSRDPADVLVLALRSGERRYTLPDDADTPGIVADLRAHRDARR
jgi:hypothetical protein